MQEAHIYPHFILSVHQNTLSSQISHDGLASADHLTLGEVKVWGAGRVAITQVIFRTQGTADVSLGFTHNQQTEVS